MSTPPKGFYRNPLQGRLWMRRLLAYAYSTYTEMARRWIQTLDTPENATFLDIGCSTGEQFSHWVSPDRGNFAIGMDVETSVLQVGTEQRIPSLVGQIEAIPLLQESLDIVCAFGVLSYMSAPVKSLSKIRSCLKPGGRMICAAAVLGGVRRASYPVFNSIRCSPTFRYIPTLSQLTTDFEQAGLKISRLDGNPLTWPLGRTPVPLNSRLRRQMACWVYLVAEPAR